MTKGYCQLSHIARNWLLTWDEEENSIHTHPV